MLLRFLEHLGVNFDMDYDGEVFFDVPKDVCHDAIEEALQPFGKGLAQEVRNRARRQRSVFVGGQWNGKTAAHLGVWNPWIRHHLRRGCWEVYEAVPDGRAFFRGYATSEKKARLGEVTKQPKAAQIGKEKS